MALTTLDWESGSNGAAVTTGATSGYSLVTVNTGATLTYSNARAANGVISQQVSAATTPTAAAFGQINMTATSALAVTLYLYFATTPAPAATTQLIRAMNGTGTTKVFDVQLTTTGRLAFGTPAVGTGSSVWTSTNPVPTGQWIRVEAFGALGGTSTTGTAICRHYLGNTSSPIETGYSNVGGETMGTLQIDSLRVGKASTSSFADTFWQDTLMYDPAATGTTGPFATLSVNAGPDQTVDPGTTVTLTATHPTGTTVVWTQVSGSPTVTLA